MVEWLDGGSGNPVRRKDDEPGWHGLHSIKGVEFRVNPVNHILLLLVAFLAVYLQSTFDLFRDIFGTQFDLLPSLIVYTALTHGVVFVGVMAFVGGLFLDSLSANPLGISIFPLFIVGLLICLFRTLLLRHKTYAQFVLGISAGALVPLLTLLGLFTLNYRPLFGWGTVLQVMLLAAVGGAVTPLLFRLLDRISRTFNYAPLPETTFRSDREIKRGRF